MADVYDTHGLGEDSYVAQYGAAGNATAKSLTNMTNIAGAVVSLALIAGVGVWGYKLMVRDVSGIPVVRAVQGDMRVRPEEPGGQLAMNQGLAVNAVAADGGTQPPADRFVLAPRPVALADEDTPILASMVVPGWHLRHSRTLLRQAARRGRMLPPRCSRVRLTIWSTS